MLILKEGELYLLNEASDGGGGGRLCKVKRAHDL